ncbi:DNA repair protein RecN [Lachnospiraceae bacterium OttesenSCG-928-E19]|nr:DNA repair protein RecN [Lachnospiraceae bacterium OttesenSCG-928-E19]
MLTNLYISNIVLIEKLDLEFGPGLNVLTGETGAGKSILLDALSLALGARSDAGLVRHGCENAGVIAEFDNVNDQIASILDENGIENTGSLILRRTLTIDGKSRAWINDVPVSVKTLKQVGDTLVEIHGQFENHSLLDQTTHRKTLDDFANINDTGFKELLANIKSSYDLYHGAQKRLREVEDMLARSAAEREFLEHNVSELSALNPQIGEEDELATKRSQMMGAERNAAILSDAVAAMNHKGAGLDGQIFGVAHILERIKTDPNPYQEQIDKLYEIASVVAEISEQLTPMETDTANLESIEERLFAIRAAARKHRVTGDELAQKLIGMREQLNTIDNSDAELKKLKSDVKNYGAEFEKHAHALTDARQKSAAELRKQILIELPDLKLGQADFTVQMDSATPSAHGMDEVTFMIKTNPGSPFAPLHKTASGGELARLMLALRVVLSSRENAHTFVFDEVDTGISGATASAVGDRLSRLASQSQALVVTHSAQVAGYANKHFKIAKNVIDDKTTTTVTLMSDTEQLNEIARIISGAEITPESLATAKTLIKK